MGKPLTENYARIDRMALAGYEYAERGCVGPMPKMADQLDADAFHAGISNFRVRSALASNAKPNAKRPQSDRVQGIPAASRKSVG